MDGQATWLRRSLTRVLLRLLPLLAAATALGGLLGSALGGLSTGLALALAWQLAEQLRLMRRLRGRLRLTPANGLGLWSEFNDLLLRRQREGRRRKRRLVTLLRAFRQAAAALPDAILVLQPPGFRIVWFNKAAGPLLGLRYPRDMGARLLNLVRQPRVTEWLERQPYQAPLMDVASPEDPAVRLSLRLIPYGGGQSLLVVRDISLMMRLEQTRRDFVANVSHELRTPLTVIHGYLDLFEPDDDPAMAGILAEMRSQSRRMTEVVDDLLTLSRLDSQDRVSDEAVPMQALLQRLLRDAEGLSRGRHRITLDDRCALDLRGAEQELYSAFSNLVSNAVRYTPDGGSIQIRFEPGADDGAVLAVQDSGPGIPAEHLPRLTERFYRVSNSRSRASGGTGLGLAIVKHILGLHQARLVIDSRVGEGSTFACHFGADRTLPRDADAPGGGAA